ncbi:TIGR04283 family arsenosugar biosynthesis glycosyltransferase [Lacihabitans soyangensis]|uniref:Glycosyltransferase n=1 Tax=Lacihabitans soyangensis TaxID=869394 RepID=A0AAE3H153_9BACT|nr:TIGR04283 family arsenosugar biosynthesis glycosyltransferase [Lacihabitans soyangensis]MCP9763099.1 glycosyltransferase [Lacihabitans soyangensis]
MTVSILIPTYNESKSIQKTVEGIIEGKGDQVIEILILDSVNSTDNLKETLAAYEVRYIKTPCNSRSSQMNYGANLAKGDILFFVHADTILPKNYVSEITKVLQFAQLGCFRAIIESKNVLLKINSFFTRLNFLWCRGGDQTLFLKKADFLELGGFDEQYVIMEDYDFLRRAQAKFKFGISKKSVIVSARKYEKNGFWRIQLANFAAMRAFLKDNATPQQIKENYTKALNLDY